MGKNKKRKKRGSGEIIKLYKNYGIISTESFGKHLEEIPFEITKEMIHITENKEVIEYSKKVDFEIRKGVFLRGKNIVEAVNLRFDKKSLIAGERKNHTLFRTS